MTALLSCLLLVACSNEDFLDEGGGTPAGEYSDNICFGVAPDASVRTRGAAGMGGGKEKVAGNFVLRAADAPDTLCMQSVVTDGIRSSAEPQVVTRSVPIDSKNKFYDSFHVVAYWKKGDVPVTGQFYMDADVFDKGNNRWATNTAYFWPGSGHMLQFYALAPIDAGIQMPTTPESAELSSYTVPDNVAEQHDVLVATTRELDGDYNDAVPLTFRHICTAVRFVTGSQMQPGSIKSVTLKGVKKTGIYDMAADKWDLAEDVGDYTQTLDKPMGGSETGSAVTTEEQTFMMLPQTLPDGAMVEVVFADNVTGKERTLYAHIAGTEWPQGTTVTYKISITPEYELEFISEPETQDAHYIIYPIHIKAGDNVPGGSWTLTSTDPDNVTLRTDLTVLTRRGFWVEEDKGTGAITSTAVGDDITVYAFLTENIGDETREIKLELRPTDRPNDNPRTFAISQYCPSWNGVLGCERIEDGDYPWGFLWPKGMKITYNMENAGLGDLIKNALLNAYLSWFTDYNQFITKETWWLSITSVTINFDAVPQVNVAQDPDNGLKNTTELYNFNGINDVSTLMSVLENWGGTTTDVLPLNPEEFAARACAMKNKYNKTIEQQGGETIQIPVLAEENLVWYLPARDEATQMEDEEVKPLNGDYWTSTVVLDDDENAYKYTAGGSISPERRDVSLHVRAVRRKP